MHGEAVQMSNFVDEVLMINIEYFLLAYLLLCAVRV